MIKILNALSCSILVFNFENKVLFINDYLLKKLDKKKEELIGKNLSEVIHSTDCSIDYFIKNHLKKMTFHYYMENKENKLFSLWGEVVKDDFKGEQAYYIVGKNDYDKKYERKDLEDLLDNVNAECCIKDINGKYIYVNQYFADNLCCKKSEILGKTGQDFFSKEDYDFMKKNEKCVIEKKEIVNKEDVYLTRGYKKWYSNTTLSPLFDINNNVKYIACSKLDITLSKFINDMLQVSLNQIMQLSCDIGYSDIDNQYKSLIQNTTQKIQEFLKADGVSIVCLDNENKKLNVLAETGKILKAFKDEDICERYGEKFFINMKKFGDGIIHLEDLNNLKNIEEANEQFIDDNISILGVYSMILDEEVIGLLLLTYEKGHEDRCIPFSYLKTICSYVSMNINNWNKCKKIEEERKKFERMNNSLMNFIDISEDIITTWDLEGNSIYFNYEFSNVLGYNNNGNKLNFFEIIHPYDKEQILNMIFDLEHDFGSVTSRVRCSDGSYKWIDWKFKVLKEEKMFFINGKDVSDRLANEKRKLLVQQAKFIEEIRDEFLSNITHEFRTPINIILGTVQLINKGLENKTYTLENLEEHTKYLRRNSNRLLRLVNNLIDITYIKNGYHELNLQNHNIVGLVENVCNTAVNNEENRFRNIVFDTESEEIKMACDADEIERIIFNLLSNAVKYSFPNDTIKVSVKCSNDNVQISVEDHGIGIPKEYLDTIFEKLIRVDSKMTRHNEGTGIGLAIVKSLVNLHSGTIKVESELGKGSKFIITLPIKLVTEEKKTVFKSYDAKNKVEKYAIEFSDIYDYN